MIINNKIVLTELEVENKIEKRKCTRGVALSLLRQDKIAELLRQIFSPSSEENFVCDYYEMTGFLDDNSLHYIKDRNQKLYDYLIFQKTLNVRSDYTDNLFSQLLKTFDNLHKIIKLCYEKQYADDDVLSYSELKLKELYDLLVNRNKEQTIQNDNIRRDAMQKNNLGCRVPKETTGLSEDMILDPDGIIVPWEVIEASMKKTGCTRDDCVSIFISNRKIDRIVEIDGTFETWLDKKEVIWNFR